jgi:hypothetical protein
VVDIEFNPRNKFDALPDRLFPGLIQPVYGVVIGQGQGGNPPFLALRISSAGRRSPSEALEWVCRSIISVCYD